MAACRADLRGEPAAEGEPEQRHLVARQRVESGEIEMHQVIDRIEILGSRGLAEPGMRRDDELAIATEKNENGRLGIDRIEAVQYQDRTPLATTQHFELDPLQSQPLRIRHGSLPPGDACGELDGDRLGSPVVHGELDEIVVGIAEVNAGRRTARARAWSGSSLWRHAVALQQSEDVVDDPIPFETEIGAPHSRLPRSQVARARRRVRPVDVDLLCVVDPDRRHVRTAWPFFPGDRETEPLVEIQRALEIPRDNDPVVDALDSHCRLPPSLPRVGSGLTHGLQVGDAALLDQAAHLPWKYCTGRFTMASTSSSIRHTSVWRSAGRCARLPSARLCERRDHVMDQEPSIQRRLAAILAADIAGYSRLMHEDEPATVRDLKAHQSVILPLVGRHGGRIIDTASDGIMAEFPSVIGATECAVEIQTVMTKRNLRVPESRRMRFRIGINLGDVIHDETRIYGDGINIAARLEALAEPGGVLVSNTVHDQVRGKLPFTFEDVGERQVKNIEQPVRTYQLHIPSASAETVSTPARRPALTDRRRWILWGLAAFVVLFGAAGAWWMGSPFFRSLAADRTEAPRLSIVVLPFSNLSGDPSQDYFADGITEDLTSDLSRIAGSFVISRNTAFTL